jgi:hypothetical protein
MKKRKNSGFAIQKAAMMREMSGVDLLSDGRDINRSICSYTRKLRQKNKDRISLQASIDAYLKGDGIITKGVE